MAADGETRSGWATLDGGLGTRLLVRAVASSSDCASVRLVCRCWALLGAAARRDLAPSGLEGRHHALSVPIEDYLPHFHGLRCLDLSAYPSRRPSTTVITSLRDLRALKLRLLPCTSGEPEWLPRVLAGLTNLTSLDLSGSLDLRNQHLVDLSLPKLQSLDLSGTTVSEVALQCLYTLTQLTRLDLSNCRNCRDCSPLAALLHIQTLSLSGCNVRDRDLESLQDLTTLRHLSLNGCRQLTSHGLAHLSGLCALCSLEAPGCVCVSDSGLQGLSRLTNLHTLNLGRWSDNYFPHVVAPGVDHCWLLTDDALVALEPFRRLRTLDMDGNKNFTDRGIRALGVFTDLQSLCLGGCGSVTDDGLEALQGLTNLRDLQLANFTGVSDTGLTTLQSLIGLRSLVLSGCYQLTDKALELLQEMTHLRALCLHGCHSMSLRAVQAAREATNTSIVWYSHPNEWVNYQQGV